MIATQNRLNGKKTVGTNSVNSEIHSREAHCNANIDRARATSNVDASPTAPNGKQENTRRSKGRFSSGNPGGPGRPKRAIEQDYAKAVRDACSPETFRLIVEKAVDRATAGDHKALEWLSKYLLGSDRLPLLDLAAGEEANRTTDREIRLAAVRSRVRLRMQHIENVDDISNVTQIESRMDPDLVDDPWSQEQLERLKEQLDFQDTDSAKSE